MVDTESFHNRLHADGRRIVVARRLVVELVRVRLLHLQVLQLVSAQLRRPSLLELVEALTDGLLTDVDRTRNLRGSTTETVQLGRDKDGGTAQTVWTSTGSHPRAIHRLDEADRGILDLLELVSELKLAAEFLDVKRRVNDRNGVLLEQDLTPENIENFGDLKQIVLNAVCEVNKQVRTLLNSTRHVKACSRDNVSVSTLRETFVDVRVVTGESMVSEAERADVLPDAKSLADVVNGATDVV